MTKRMNDEGGSRSTRTLKKGRASGGEPMEDNPLHEAFLDEIADIYNAEVQLTKALPKMANAARSEELREAFESHLAETEQQIRRIEEALESLGETVKRKKCQAMEGLLAEAKEMMGEYKNDPALDAVMISAAQKVEHYEIASYGTICTWAEQMGHRSALQLFKENLSEEKAADETLTEIAETAANLDAEAQP